MVSGGQSVEEQRATVNRARGEGWPQQAVGDFLLAFHFQVRRVVDDAAGLMGSVAGSRLSAEEARVTADRERGVELALLELVIERVEARAELLRAARAELAPKAPTRATSETVGWTPYSGAVTWETNRGKLLVEVQALVADPLDRLTPVSITYVALVETRAELHPDRHTIAEQDALLEAVRGGVRAVAVELPF